MSRHCHRGCRKKHKHHWRSKSSTSSSSYCSSHCHKKHRHHWKEESSSSSSYCHSGCRKHHHHRWYEESTTSESWCHTGCRKHHHHHFRDCSSSSSETTYIVGRWTGGCPGVGYWVPISRPDGYHRNGLPKRWKVWEVKGRC